MSHLPLPLNLFSWNWSCQYNSFSVENVFFVYRGVNCNDVLTVLNYKGSTRVKTLSLPRMFLTDTDGGSPQKNVSG